MINTIKKLGIIALAAIIGFSFIACGPDPEGNGNGNGGVDPVAAAWANLNVDGSQFEKRSYDSETHKGRIKFIEEGGQKKLAFGRQQNGQAINPLLNTFLDITAFSTDSITFAPTTGDPITFTYEYNDEYTIRLTISDWDGANANHMNGDYRLATYPGVPVAEHYVVGNRMQAVGSTITAVTVNRAVADIELTSNGAISNIRYNGETAVPQGLGTYAITFDVAASAPHWLAAEGVSGGNLEVFNPPQFANWANWTQTTGTSPNSIDIKFLNNMFIGVRSSTIASSTDGIAWTSATLPASALGPDNQNRYVNDITFGNGKWVIVTTSGFPGANRAWIVYSENRTTWTQATITPAMAEFEAIQIVAFGDGKFIAFTSGETARRVLTSTDGITWTAAGTYNFAAPRNVVYGGGKLVAVGNGGIHYSTDGSTWTFVAGTSDGFDGFNNVVYADGKFVAVRNNRSAVSANGETWSISNSTIAGSNYLTYGGGFFVTSGSYSGDGISWLPFAGSPPVDANPSGLAFGAGKFVRANFYSHYVLVE